MKSSLAAILAALPLAASAAGGGSAPASAAAASASAAAASGMSDTTKILLTLFLTPALGAIAAVYTTNAKLRQERQIDRDKSREHVRLKVLNPLLIAAEDLLDRIADVNRRRKDAAGREAMQRWFLQVKDKPRQDPDGFARWANDEGYFAISTLYVTALYFHYAGTIRRDFPFLELGAGGETTLLARLSQARLSIGGKFGIWEAMQDSLGAYLAGKDAVKNYREFCEMLIDEKQSAWFNRLADFYRDIHLKLDDHLANVEDSLHELISFLRGNLQIAALRYRLDEKSIEALHDRGLPAAMVVKLQALVGQADRDEVGFVATLVKCIGQDLADDYKPSILRFAQKRLA